MRVLVTGHAGFIGSHLAEALLAMGHETIGIDSLNDYYDRRLKVRNVEELVRRGLVSRTLDLATDSLAGALDGVDAVFHLAAQPGISASTTFDSYLANNVVATERLVAEAVRAKGVKLFVYGSTSSVYGKMATEGENAVPAPISWYGATKLCAEQLVLSAARVGALPGCSLRLYSVYGPRERPDKALPKLLRCADDGTPFPLHEGSDKHTRSFTYVSDAVAGFTAAIANRGRLIGEIVNIGSDQEAPMSRLLECVERAAGRKLAIRIIGPRRGDQSNTRANIEKARRLLGYRPAVSLDEGIAKSYAWFKSQPR